MNRRWRPPRVLAALLGAVAPAACGPTFGSGGDMPAGAAGTGGAAGRGSSTAGSGGATGSSGASQVGAAGGGMQHTAGSSQGGHAPIAGRAGAGATGEADAGEEAQGGSNATAGNTATSGDGAGAASGNSATGGVGGLTGGAGFGGGGATSSGGAGNGGTTAGSSSGGTNAAGGSSGNAGAGAGGAPSFCMPALVIDDMEDGDDRNCPNQGRSGDWWTATGETGTIEPPSQGNFPAYALGGDARARSEYGMRLAGTGFGYTEDDWASLGFDLAAGAAYDLAAYQGLAFYGKSRAGALTIHVKVATSVTTPVSEGGECEEDCNDHYKGVVTLDGTWRELLVDFSGLVQEGWGQKPKALERALFIYFGYLGTDLGPTSFEFLIDDVRLY
jgi:hypothetical protein